MLEIKHISKTFNPGTVNEKQALKDLSLTLKNGDFVKAIAHDMNFDYLKAGNGDKAYSILIDHLMMPLNVVKPEK